MNRLRVLLLAPDCDPEDISIPFVTYCHAAALAQLHDVTLVAGSTVEDARAPRKGAVSRHRGGPDAMARPHLCVGFSQDLQV